MVPYLVSGQYNLLARTLGALHLDVQDAAGQSVAAVEVITEVQMADPFNIPLGVQSPLRRILSELLDCCADCLLENVVPFTLAGPSCIPCRPTWPGVERRGFGWQRILCLLIQRR
jgi:hypothetical protein